MLFQSKFMIFRLQDSDGAASRRRASYYKHPDQEIKPYTTSNSENELEHGHGLELGLEPRRDPELGHGFELGDELEHGHDLAGPYFRTDVKATLCTKRRNFMDSYPENRLDPRKVKENKRTLTRFVTLKHWKRCSKMIEKTRNQ